MLWKITTWYFLLTMIVWVGLDFRDHAASPYRWVLWLAPSVSLAWVLFLHWNDS